MKYLTSFVKNDIIKSSKKKERKREKNMTKVSYEVRKEGFKGCITVNTFDEAVEKAKQIGGTYKAVYSEVETAPMTERDLRLRAKRMAHFGIAQRR